MRLAGNIPDETEAKRFVDYLYTQQISAMAEPTRQGTWDIWIHHEDQLAESKRALEAYLLDPGGEQYRAAPVQARQMADEARKRRQQVAGNFILLSQRWKRPGSRGPRQLTLALIALCTGIWLLPSLGSERQSFEPYLSMTAKRGLSPQQVIVPNRRIAENPNLSQAELHELVARQQQSLPEIRHGQLWRLVTPMLLHQSFFHLLFNMYWLFLLGGMIEDRYGSLWLAWFVVLTAAISNLAQYFWHGPNFAGFSGVNYALFGYVWIKSKYDLASGFFLDPRDVFLMLVWFVVCFTGWVGPIANGAHAGGLVAGVVLGYLPQWLKR